jgi:hypothetical protein
MLSTLFALVTDPVAPSSQTAADVIAALTPIIVPILIWGVKLATDRIPKEALPILAAALGVLADYVNTLVTAGGHGIIVGALLGLAGVGVREVTDQLFGPPTAH